MTLAPPRPRPGTPPGASARGDRPPAAGRPRDRRLRGADELRALATVAVVVVHASYWAGRSTPVEAGVYRDVTLLARFCVPAFVLLGGLLLGYRYPHGAGPGFAARRARRSVIPWLAWAPVACVVGLLLGQVAASPSAVWQWWAGGGGHLYYLVLVPQLYLLYMVWPRGGRAATALAVVAVAVQGALEVVRLVIPRDGGLAGAVLLWHGYELAPLWAGYFALGVVVGRRWSRSAGSAGVRSGLAGAALVPVTGAALVAAGVMGSANSDFVQGTGAFLRPLLLPFTLAVCWAALGLLPAMAARLPRLRRGIDVVARHSLGIYIVHPFLLTGIGRALGPVLGGPLPVSAVGLTLTVGLTMVGALCVVRLLVTLPVARTLGDARRPLRRGPAEVELLGRRTAAERVATVTRTG